MPTMLRVGRENIDIPMPWNHCLQLNQRFNKGRQCRRILFAGGAVVAIVHLRDFVTDQRPTDDTVELGYMTVSVADGAIL